ncbi:sensor histidine kinase [Ruminiclostridium cellobioparum]|uniref:sensor histidine kinase n=1 Tax=Ruminiclostridium cellobioparum TaxID=29355 RepID=UPI0028AD7AE1|nr:sensor histidine kinase [Ruminiclostridium cellobioparum]
MIKTVIKKLTSRLTIKAKLIIICIIFLCYPTVIIGYFGYQHVSETLKEKSFNYSKATIDELSVIFSERLETLRAFSFQILYDNTIYEANSDIELGKIDYSWEVNFTKYLKANLYSKYEFTELSVFFTSTEKLYQVNKSNTGNTPASFISADLYRQARTGNGSPVWVVDQQDNGINDLYLTKLVLSPSGSGSEIALIVFKIDQSELFKTFKNFEFTLKHDLSVTSSNNIELYSFNTGNQRIELSKLQLDGDIPEISETRIGNDTIYYVCKTMQPSNWKLVIKISSNELLKDVKSEASIVIILCLIGLPIILMLINFLYIDLIRPLNLLIKKMLMIEKGTIGVTIDISRTDEIGYVIRSFNNMSQQIYTLINKVLKVQLAVKDSEIKALQAQINPHFLYNTLETINWKAKINGVEEISEMVGALSCIIDANLNRSGENTILLKKEIEYIKNYNLIISKRFGTKIAFVLNVADDTLNCKIPKLIIQPLIENSVYHGLEMKKGGGTIELNIYKSENILYINVSDDGLGISPGTLTSLNEKMQEDIFNNIEANIYDSSKIGVINVHRRLKLLYGDEYGLVIHSRLRQGTSILIKIPAEE